MLARALSFSFVLLLCATAQAFDLAVVVGSDATYGNLNAFNQDVYDFYETRFGYTNHMLTATEALAVADWSVYDGVLILGVENADLSALADSAIPILSMSNTETLKMATSIGYLAIGTTFLMVKEVADHFTVNYSMDTLWLAHSGGTGATALQVLADGVQSVWNATTLYGKDTAAVAIAETGATLTSGTAPARRAIVGVFFSATVSGEYTTQNDCHPWELLGNVSAWTFGDTLNATWWSEVCFTDKLEVNMAWGEYGSSGARTFTDYMRFGVDPSVTGKFGDGVTFEKIWPLALKTKLHPSFATIDSCYLDNYVVKLHQIDNATSGFDFDVKLHKIIVENKWHAPASEVGGGYSADSTWVGRINVIGGPDSILWSDTNLVSGVDYDAEVGDSIRINATSTPVDGSLNLFIPSAWVQDWYSDTTSCNGVVWVSYVSEDNYCEDTYCDVEIAPYAPGYGDQYPPYTHVWKIAASATTGWTGDDLTPSIKMGAYLTGADHISASDVFQRTAGDDSTFFKRWEYLIGIGDGMESYLDEMIYYGCFTSNYVSGPDMPNDHGLTGQEPTYNQLGKKHDFITGDAVGEKYWLHYHDLTDVDSSATATYEVAGTGSMTATDGDSVSRVNHYANKWSGDQYTYPTRPVFNFTDSSARNDYTSFIQVLFGDSSDAWFSGKTATADTHYAALYLDNFDSLRLQSFTVSSGGAVIELDSAIVGTETATNTYWSGMKTWLSELRSTVDPIFADSLQIGINVGSETWSYDYIYDVPRGTMINLEFGVGPLQMKGAPGSEWTLDSLAVWDSTACAKGITFFYCSGPWEQQTTYRNSVWDYHGYSTSAWSVYMRMAYYQAIKSDSSILYCMPAFDGAYYQGYSFDGHSTSYYDWDAKNYAFAAADFDTMSWQASFTRDIGSALAMPELDTSYAYNDGQGHTARIYSREFDSAYVFVRPLDDANEVPWGKRADSLGYTATITLPDTCKLLLPDNTLTDSSFTAYEMNPGDGFVFIKASAAAEPATSATTTLRGLTIGRMTIK